MKLRGIISVVAAMFVFACTLRAQTTYTQTTPLNCQSETFICQRIQLGSGNFYGFVDGSTSLHVGREFYIDINGTLWVGNITEVTQEPPAFVAGNSGEFSFTWKAGGHTGTVSGTVKFIGAGRGGTVAQIEASVVEVDQ